MNLYLAQHAKAKPAEVDPERPLTEEGTVDSRRVASYIARNTDSRVAAILHSGALRAQQTAEIFAEYLKPPGGVREEKELSPNSQPWTWIEKLAEVEADIMIVGHLPHLRRLTSLLLCQDEGKNVIDYQNAGVVCLTRNESGVWLLHWIVIPRIIPRLEVR